MRHKHSWILMAGCILSVNCQT